jgi:hypothetical protein
MRIRKSEIHLSIALLVIISSGTNLYGQTNSETSLYNWFDNTVGKENLGAHNGSLHINPYRTVDKNNHCYIYEEFNKGDISYDGQSYYDVNLKYDVYKDALIIKPHETSDYMSVNLIQEKTDSFSINGKNFVNLSHSKSALPEFIKGYYEEIPIGNKIIFYIKHHKDRREIIKDVTVYNEFEEKNEFFLNYENTFYKVNTKKEIVKIFPKYKNKIDDFYSENKDMEKSNKNKFTENLMKFISNFISNKSN